MHAPMRMLLAAALIAAAGAVQAQPQTRPPAQRDAKPSGDCFLSRDWDGWSVPAAGKGDVLYLRIRPNDVFRVELTPGSGARKGGNTFLVNEVRGSPWICSPLDLDLVLSDNLGLRQPLIARSLRRLTPQEVAAIPRNERP